MAIGLTFFIVAILVVAIYVVVELKRFRHKFFALFLIGLVLFTYLSFTYVIKDKDLNLKTVPGMIEGTKLYFSWLGSIFGNFKTITANAIKLDWNGDDIQNKTKG